MSLLLDALKKAAEHKAKKGLPEEPELGDSDATVVRAGSADISGFDVDAAGGAGAGDDETELSHHELRSRLGSGGSRRIAGDDTGFEIGESTQTAIEPGPVEDEGDDETRSDLPEATRTIVDPRAAEGEGDDETGLDLSEVTRTVIAPPTAENEGDDETRADFSEVTRTVLDPPPVENEDGDESRDDFAEVTRTSIDPTSVGYDSDENSQPGYVDATETYSSELTEQMQTGDDETIVFPEDATDFTESTESPTSSLVGEDDTDINQTVTTAAGINLTLQEKSSEAGEVTGSTYGTAPDTETGIFEDEDLSLLLVEDDHTKPRSRTGLTEPAELQDISHLTGGTTQIDSDSTITSPAALANPAAITSPVAGRGYADTTTRAAHGNTQSALTQTGATSTRTYAPDNYDRTLMKPSDDASKIYAGMKSDSDVVMTPDYAKKVFRSKTSEQRAQHYKRYGGVAIIIFLAIGVYGAFEYQSESSAIDDSLLRLKRDPMPGAIRIEEPEEIELFAETDERTIEIIESASDVPATVQTDDGTIQEDATETSLSQEGVTEAAADVTETAAGVTEAVTDKVPASSIETDVALVEPRQSQGVGEQVAPVEIRVQSASAEAKDITSVKNLHIESTRQVSQNDIWLQEAYAAYQSGDYSKAMGLYNEVLEADPNNRNALLARAAINIHDGYTEAAIRDYRSLLLVNPKDSLAMSSLLAVNSYDPGEIESQLKLMIRDDPDSPHLNFALANAYGAQGRWPEAQAHYFRALESNPDDPNYAYNLAVSLEHISQPASAMAYYRRALDNFENGLATFNRDLVDQRLQLLGKL